MRLATGGAVPVPRAAETVTDVTSNEKMTSSTPLLFTELKEHAPVYTTGILPSQSIEELIAAGHVMANPPVTPEQIQPSSLDLRIGPVAYRIRASFLSSRNGPAWCTIE